MVTRTSAPRGGTRTSRNGVQAGAVAIRTAASSPPIESNTSSGSAAPNGVSLTRAQPVISMRQPSGTAIGGEVIQTGVVATAGWEAASAGAASSSRQYRPEYGAAGESRTAPRRPGCVSSERRHPLRSRASRFSKSPSASGVDAVAAPAASRAMRSMSGSSAQPGRRGLAPTSPSGQIDWNSRRRRSSSNCSAASQRANAAA